MLNFKHVRVAAVAAAFGALALSSSATPRLIIAELEKPSVASDSPPESIPASPAPIDVTSTFYTVRQDLRRCVSPLCGGYFVKRVNMTSTRCADGRLMSECYVAGIDWNGHPQSDVGHSLVRGSIVAKRFGHFGNLGELRVSDSWLTISDRQPIGTYYLVRDSGVRCIAAPCPTHREAQLNSSFARNIAGVDLEDWGRGESNARLAYAAMNGPDGVIVVGHDVAVTGPGGGLFKLKGTQAYFRHKPESASMKPCFKTGCSNQVCADHEVTTTCEFRPEYACYRKAQCTRQRDGNCGFTQTPELSACLRRR